MQEEAVASFRPSPQQEQLWLREPDGPTGRNQVVVSIAGSVDDDRLRDALAGAVARHEILRTTFQRRTGIRVPLQVVRDRLEPRWDVVDLTAHDSTAREGELEALAERDRSAAIDYEAGPLLSTTLAVLSDDRRALVVTAPALCADLVSLTTLVRELAALYGGGRVADEPLQYADFAEWQHELLQGEDDDAERARAFWSRLEPMRPAGIPFLRPGTVSSPASRSVLQLQDDAVAAIEGTADQFGVGSEIVVLAAWAVLLGRLGGAEEVDLAVTLPERRHAELDGALGAFARAVPVRISLAGAPTFAEVLDRVTRASAEAAGWQDYLRLDGTEAPEAGFCASEPAASVEAGNASFDLRDAVQAPGGQSLTLEWTLARGRRDAALVHDAASFEAEQAERLGRRLERVLGALTADPKASIDDVELVDDEERRELLFDVNATRADVPDTTIDALVRAACAKRPDAIAVVDDSSSITYAQLDARVNQVAHRLARIGVTAGGVVGLCTDRSVDMVVGLLGILRAGAAYLPLHYEHPPARLAHQLAETEARALLTQHALKDRLPAFDGVTIELDGTELSGEPTTPPDPAGAATDLVYVMYTSGSTGTPKGVAVTNANLANYVADMLRRLDAQDADWTFGVVTAISTDLGNTSVFPALCSGSTLSLISPAVAADPGALTARMREHPVDVLKITPSHLNALLVGADAAALLPRRWLILGGEACSWDLVARVRELSDCGILNHYGPTETTVGSCTMLVDDLAGAYAPATVPIGRPISNTACYVLDGRGRPVPAGVAGALFIAGAGVTRGYVAQEELTSERFLPDPFDAVPGGRMYATGDLARRLPDGTLEFLGRADEQVKIRGFRVEPAEVEAALRGFVGVREAAVVAREDGGGDKRLVAYVVGSGSVDAEQLRTQLAGWVPEFMVPSAFVALDELPRTPSGKVDRLALPEPQAAAARAETVAPRTPMEERVAQIWAEVLGLEQVSVTDDFFALGGHSLLATQIVAQIRTDLAVDLPLHSLFTSPTVESLSVAIVELMGESSDAETMAVLAELEGLSDEDAARMLAGSETSEDA
jgi:amino acid adenylation domain-containing protein